jgi:hypothetical protein
MLGKLIALAALVVVVLAATYFGFSKSTEAQNVRASLSDAFAGLWKAWCWIYIIPWRLWYRLRHTAAQTFILIITAISFLVVGESFLMLLHHQELAKYIPGISEEILKRLPHLSLWVDGPALLLAVFLSLHHLSEWKAGQRKEKLPRAVEDILLKVRRYEKKISLLDDTEKKQFFEFLIKNFRNVLELRRRKRISVSLMEENGGTLGVTYTHESGPDNRFNLKLSLKQNQGGAGISYAGPASVYIPSVFHLVAINAETIKPVGVFERTEPKEPFRSLLCIPVLGKAKVVGVLTFGSRKRNAFTPADYQIMRLAASFVSFLFD